MIGSLSGKLSAMAMAALISGCVTAGPVAPHRVELTASGRIAESGAASGAESTSDSTDEQRVIYALDPAYRMNPPNCAIVMAADERHAGSVLAAEVERAIAAYLSPKMDRLIAGTKRDRMFRRQAVDPNHPADRRFFARKADCRSFLTWRFTEASQTYLLAWSNRRIGLELELTRISGDDVLWRARHAASRSGGGLPLSPVGLVIDSVNAGNFINNGDITPSMIHDVVRRLLSTLPPST